MQKMLLSNSTNKEQICFSNYTIEMEFYKYSFYGDYHPMCPEMAMFYSACKSPFLKKMETIAFLLE